MENSDLNVNTLPPIGAQGVMQLMPYASKFISISDPFNVRSNIMRGANYIAKKID